MKKLLVLSVALASSALFAAPSETYYSCGGGYYSDVPRNMKAGRCTVKTASGVIVKPQEAEAAPAKPLSLAEQQAQLAVKVAEENKRREEEYNKQQAEAKAENCKAAQMNKETVEKTNARNKDQLLPKYEADIAKYCN